MSASDGGSAFPRDVAPGNGHALVHHPGMTLRDYFAAAALPAYIAAQMRTAETGGDLSDEDIAADTHLIADIMLKERAK